MKYIFDEIRLIIKANDINARYLDIPAKKNRVNIFQYHPQRFGYTMFQKIDYNLGDSLGEVIIKFLLRQKGIDIDKPVSKTKHFYCVGTNIHGAYQSATIWGSGIYPSRSKIDFFLQKLSGRKLDVRAVRGPLTKQVLEQYGFKCPEIFGDPAILMPLIYLPATEKKKDYIVIPQFINEIIASKMVYTSSLHGIILAEAYGVPAVLYRSLEKWKDFKFLDYYYSTGRKNIKIAESLEEAMEMEPLPLPDLSEMQKGLLDTFPYDLWEP